MKKLEINEIKQLSFEVLCAVQDVCDGHDISYSLTGGTLIGAVRHKGFIPWDDDIDIMMPRPDYDRFISIVRDENDPPFRLLAAGINGEAYPYPFAKACHPKTILIEHGTRQSNLQLGVYVDIFPVDGIANSYRGAKLRCMMFQLLHGLKVTSNWTTYHHSKLRRWYYEPFRYVCYLVSKILPQRWIDKMLDNFVRRRHFSDSKYVGRLVGDLGSKEIALKELFEQKTSVEFEGKRFDAVADYHTFLSNLFGDYMTLPPIEKQVSHHEFEAFLID